MQLVKNHLDKSIGFLDKYLALSNGHMVDFFTKSLYKNSIPDIFQEEIKILGYDEVIKCIINEEEIKGVHLNEFIQTAKKFSLYNSDLCLTLNAFKEQLNCLDMIGLKLNSFMRPKKAHEVGTLSEIAASVAKLTETSHLVDIGDGKGYLSSLLAFQYKLPVLGVDASLMNTASAVKRATKLQKHWHHVAKIPKDSEYYSKILQNAFLYKQVTQFVTERTDFLTLVSDTFLEKPNGLGLVGLHTCGNLGPSSIRIFNSNANIRSICNVSCCYHLLNEHYLACETTLNDSEDYDGFPMSNYLKTKEYNLGRAARMLSAQSIDRILHNQDLPNKIIFYRAILEVLIEEMHRQPREKNVGRYKKEPENFEEYSKVALKRLNINLDLTDEQLNEYYERFLNGRKELNIYHLIRSMLAPVIEAIILLDRYLFLLEQGHEKVFLVRLFDPVISPRCYGLIALKT